MTGRQRIYNVFLRDGRVTQETGENVAEVIRRLIFQRHYQPEEIERVRLHPSEEAADHDHPEM